MESLLEGDLISILRNRRIDIERTFTRVKVSHKGEQYEFMNQLFLMTKMAKVDKDEFTAMNQKF